MYTIESGCQKQQWYSTVVVVVVLIYNLEYLYLFQRRPECIYPLTSMISEKQIRVISLLMDGFELLLFLNYKLFTFRVTAIFQDQDLVFFVFIPLIDVRLD